MDADRPQSRSDAALEPGTRALLDIVVARRGHFSLESGYHADTWLELDRLFTRPAQLRPFVSLLASKISEHRVEAVCGPLTGGAFLAQMIAAELGLAVCWSERVPSVRTGLFAVDYRIPSPLHDTVASRRVAVVDDAISAGSAVLGTLADLEAHAARPVVLGALLVLGAVGRQFAAARGIPIECLTDLPFLAWPPAECPPCASRVPLDQT
jgi:orotate phosphoribosyltransferase